MSTAEEAVEAIEQAETRRAVAPRMPTGTAHLTQAEKAAIVIGALGADAAGPVLENLDESSLRSFTGAMARLRRVEPGVVRLVIAEFLDALRDHDRQIRGGLNKAREVLEPHVNQNLLGRLLDDLDSPSASNVWKKLSKVNEEALADYLSREHAQTAAIILSKLPSEHAAKVLNRFEPDRAREVVLGITRTQTLDPHVIEAIGTSVSRDFLATAAHAAPRRNPAERIGAIMNFVNVQMRDHVLGHIEDTQPDFAEEVRRKMFTFDDIPKRIAPRDVALFVRETDRGTLIRALRFSEDAGSEAGEFILGNISSRVSDQLRSEMTEIDKVRRKDGEAAHAEVVGVIRQIEERGDLKMMALDDDG
ncbi:MAG: FliG C-terminal domain-containing protein [Pseudomonadota bacterium]